MASLAAIISVTSGLGYALPAVIGLESLGLPSPGETAMILAAVLASQGKLDIVLVIVIGCASAIVGDNIGYFLGRRLGRQVLEAPGPLQKRRKLLIAAGDRFFQKHGGKSVFLARWVALVRVAAAWLAGINKMRFIEFFLWNAAGGITWGITVGLVGYYGGKKVADAITHYGLFAAIGVGVVIVAFVAFARRREHRAAHALAVSAPSAEDESSPSFETEPETEPEPEPTQASEPSPES